MTQNRFTSLNEDLDRYSAFQMKQTVLDPGLIIEQVHLGFLFCFIIGYDLLPSSVSVLRL